MSIRKLSYITIPIGNPLDLTRRAGRAVEESQVLLAEEIKPARILLKALNLSFYEGEFEPQKNEIFLFRVDENLSADDREYLRTQVLPLSQRVGYISGAGSPLFEDPGSILEPLLNGFVIERIPGVTSLGALMMYFPGEIKKFQMAGFLSQKSEDRSREITRIKNLKEPTFLMETPYRRQKLLEELQVGLPGWKILLGYKLTTDEERIFLGKIKDVSSQVKVLAKGEFVALVYP